MSKRKKERPGLPRRYTFKLAPTPAQETAMLEQCRMIAMLWNSLLQRNEDIYRSKCGQRGVTHLARDQIAEKARLISRTEKTHQRMLDPDSRSPLSHFDMNKEIVQLREEMPEWAALSTWTGNRVAFALVKAFDGFFHRAKQGAGASSGFPQYRSTRRANWLPYIFHSGIKLKPSDGTSKKKWRLGLPGIPGRIRCFGEFPAQPLAWSDADIRQEHGSWWLSVCVDVAKRREPGTERGTIRFNLVDTFAGIDGNIPAVPTWGDVLVEQERLDVLKAERDSRYPRKRGTRPTCNWRRITRRIGKLSSHIARKRRERLHEWTTAVAAHVSDLTIVAPPVKEVTKSAKGTEKDWGAAVEPVAHLNRHVLSQAPASAIAMLRYKAAEAGIRVDLKEDAHPPVAIGRGLSEATKAVRHARRALRKVSDNGRHKHGDERARSGDQGRRAAHDGSA